MFIEEMLLAIFESVPHCSAFEGSFSANDLFFNDNLFC